jgi:uncharacterized protein with WD repeat
MQPALASDGTRIAVPTDAGRVVLVDAASLEVVHAFEHDTNEATVCDFSPDGATLLVAGRSIKLWDANSQKLIAELEGPAHTVWTAAFSPDRQYAVTGSGAELRADKPWDSTGEICVWDTATHELVLKFPAHDFGVYDLDFSHDGQSLFTTGFDGHVRQWVFESLLGHAAAKVSRADQ